jgi:hypothetical protein
MTPKIKTEDNNCLDRYIILRERLLEHNSFPVPTEAQYFSRRMLASVLHISLTIPCASEDKNERTYAKRQACILDLLTHCQDRLLGFFQACVHI